MTPDQASTLLASIETGNGRHVACLAAGISLAELATAIAADPAFADRLALAEGSLRDNARAVIYLKAVAGDEEITGARVTAAQAYLRSLTDERLATAQERFAASDEVRTANESALNFKALNDFELPRYGELQDLLLTRDLDPAEAVEFAAYTRKLATPPEPVAAVERELPRIISLRRPVHGANGHNGNGHANGNGHK